MTKITAITKGNLNAFHVAAQDALLALAKQHGLTVRRHGGTLESDTAATLKFRFTVDDPQAQEATERKQFTDLAFLFGLKPEHFGATFINLGTAYTVCGIDSRKRKNPIKAKRASDGKVFLFPEAVARLLDKPAAA